MDEEKQPIRNFNERETDLIKATFKENEFLLKAIRALMFGLEVTQQEKDTIKSTFANEELRKIMWKRFYPTLDKDTPIGQVQDVWLGAESMVFGQPKEVGYQAVQYKQRALEMTKQALELLENPDLKPLSLEYNPKVNLMDDYNINLLARNQFIRHIESQLNFLWIISSQVEKTPEQLKNERKLDSSK